MIYLVVVSEANQPLSCLQLLPLHWRRDAGDVLYNIYKFNQKNKENLTAEMKTLMSASSNALVVEVSILLSSGIFYLFFICGRAQTVGSTRRPSCTLMMVYPVRNTFGSTVQ